MRLRMRLRWSLAAATVMAAQTDHPLRPRFHFTPAKNFMNDPNGLVFLDGEYHLFYQHNPEGDRWGHMSWGHAVSRDLLRWEHLPLAMREEDGIMIFSGSAVVDRANTSGLCGASRRRLPRRHLHRPHRRSGRRRTWRSATIAGARGPSTPATPSSICRAATIATRRCSGTRRSKRWIMVTVLADERKVRLFSLDRSQAMGRC